MSFHWPHLFWLLVVPVFGLVLDLTRKRKSARLAHPKILQADAAPHALELRDTNRLGRSGLRVRWRFWLGLALATTALARPQWGRIEEPVFDQSREILIAVDLSRSMLAEDVRPSRLARAKLLITSLLERLEGERVGLIVFAGTAFLQSPLSADYEILREFLPTLGPDYLPQGGTDYGAMLDAASEAFTEGSGADRFLIVLSDGESQTEDWRKAAEALKKQKVRVLSLGVGTSDGAMLPDGQGSFIKDERGAVVLSRLNATTLEEIARQTNGVYRDASAWVDLSALLNQTVEAGRQGEFTETQYVRLAERFQWALAPALFFLLWSFWREFPVHPKSRRITLKAKGAAAATGVSALILLTGLLAVTPSTAHAQAAAPTPPPADPFAAPLAKTVGRLSTVPQLGASDYAELANTTITYGQRMATSRQEPAEGAIRDALAGVDAGSALDPDAANWADLRSKLEAFLKKPEDQNQSNEDQDKKDEENQDDKPGEGKSSPDQKGQKGDKSDPSKPSDPNGEEQSEESDQSEKSDDPNASDEQKGDDQAQPKPRPSDPSSAFGDMNESNSTGQNEPPPPEPPPGETQTVGGQPDKPTAEQSDPSLTMPLQKLDQLREQDSPAKLFQLMQDPKAPPAVKGRDW